MPEAKTLHDMFIDEIRDVYDAERQISKALPKIIKTATTPELKEALDAHLEETRVQIERLTRIFGELGQKARGKRCEGIAGILEEGRAVLQEELDEATMDACLIAAGQRVEHYEIAAYGSLVAWAQVLKLDGVVDLLQATLDEEMQADKKLSTIAKGGVNKEAANVGDLEDQDAESEAGGARKGSSKRSSDRSGPRNAQKLQSQLGQGNAQGRPASQLGKQVPANEQGRRLQNQPGRTGSRRANR
jgi:ferritin-like metal-binding protein YciE